MNDTSMSLASAPAWNQSNASMESAPPGYYLIPQSLRPPMSQATVERIDRLQSLLNMKLGPEMLSSRQGGGGTKLTYIEGWRVINLANEVFGYNGWTSEVKTLEIDFLECDPETHRYSMGVTAIVRVTLKDGCSREDIGYGKAENVKSRADSLDKCKKEAVTDALKRALRTFGNLLGNCLYDKTYVSEVAKMKAPKPKFDCDQLYRPSHTTSAQPTAKAISGAPSPGAIEGSAPNPSKGPQQAPQQPAASSLPLKQADGQMMPSGAAGLAVHPRANNQPAKAIPPHMQAAMKNQPRAPTPKQKPLQPSTAGHSAIDFSDLDESFFNDASNDLQEDSVADLSQAVVLHQSKPATGRPADRQAANQGPRTSSPNEFRRQAKTSGLSPATKSAICSTEAGQHASRAMLQPSKSTGVPGLPTSRLPAPAQVVHNARTPSLPSKPQTAQLPSARSNNVMQASHKVATAFADGPNPAANGFNSARKLKRVAPDAEIEDEQSSAIDEDPFGNESEQAAIGPETFKRPRIS